MKSLQQAKEVQQQIDIVLSRPMLPIGDVYESNTELDWLEWDEAKEKQDEIYSIAVYK